MPQFDSITFFNQLWWLLVIFFALHFVVAHKFLPLIAALVKARKKKAAQAGAQYAELVRAQSSLQQKSMASYFQCLSFATPLVAQKLQSFLQYFAETALVAPFQRFASTYTDMQRGYFRGLQAFFLLRQNRANLHVITSSTGKGEKKK